MAYISFQPTDFYTTTLYSGNATTDTAINLGLEPALTWVKATNDTDGWWQGDVLSGPTKDLRSSNNAAQATSNYGTAYTSTGFTLSDGTQNQASTDYIAYSWKGGTTTGLSGGTITPTDYSFNATSGCSIIRYTGNLTAGANITHGLGVAPEFIIVKKTSGTANWMIYSLNQGAGKYLNLNTTSATGTGADVWSNTEATSTLFYIGADANSNGSGDDFVAYCFAPIKGYSKFGSYTGNGNADGPFIFTGFQPAYVMIKKTSGAGGWWIFNNKSLGYNPNNGRVYPNANDAQSTAGGVDLVSNGFKLRHTDGDTNASAGTYFYVAFAEFPFVSSNSIPTVAR